nr:nucleolar protein 14 [Hymenolepis microstoma]
MKHKPDNKRVKVLSKQLREVGKVGRVIDKRIGSKETGVSESDASIRRHIIEKLRQMETLGTTSPDDDDPLIKAVSGLVKPGKPASYDDELGGLSADIVESELFAGGDEADTLGTSVAANKQSKHDALLVKIAQSKEERLKRVEENEATRQKLKDADSDWANNIRFRLAELMTLKPKNPKAAEKMERNRSEVLSLLNNFVFDKRVAPVGTRVETEETKNNKLLTNLENIVSKRAGEMDTTESKDNLKTEDIILRLLCQIDTYSLTIVARIAEELRSLDVIQLSDVVRGLLLTQIILTDAITRKLERSGDQSTPQTKTFADRNRFKAIFVPEAVRYLIRLIETSTREDGVLFIGEDASTKDPEAYSTLDLQVALKQRPLKDNEIPTYRLGCLDKCLSLAASFLELYSEHFPAPAVCCVFSGLNLTRLKTENLPAGIEAKVQNLTEKITEVRGQPRPKDIAVVDKVSLILADKTATPQALQKIGLVPQLEPEFEEKMDARRPKKKPAHVDIRQKLSKERRSVMRELRKDAQFLSNYDRVKIKANDEMRKKKTLDVIAKMRSID